MYIRIRAHPLNEFVHEDVIAVCTTHVHPATLDKKRVLGPERKPNDQPPQLKHNKKKAVTGNDCISYLAE